MELPKRTNNRCPDAPGWRALPLGRWLCHDLQRHCLGVSRRPPRLQHGLPLPCSCLCSRANAMQLAVNGDTKFSGSGKGAGLYFTGIPEWKKLSTTLKFSYSEEDNNVDTPIVVSGRIANVDHELQTLSAGVLISPKNPHDPVICVFT